MVVMLLPPYLPSFVSLRDLHSCLLLAAAAALLPPPLSPCMMSILACSWLPLPPCPPSFVSLHDLHSGLLLAATAALSPFICFPAWSPFWPALGCRCRLVSLHDLHSGLLLAATAALSPFICFVTLHSLSFVSQYWFLCPPPPASPFIAFHLCRGFFGNAIWGLCRCIFFWRF